MIKHTKTNNLILLVLATLLGLAITVIILTLNRGFDFTDEGCDLLSYKYASVYKGGIINSHIIIAEVTDWLNPGILTYRWLKLILSIVSSSILCFGLYKWLNTRKEENNFNHSFLFIFFFLSLGSLLIFFTGTKTININALTQFFLQTATGLVLYLFSKEPAVVLKSRTNLIILLMIGFLCAFGFFVKFSTGILQFATYIIIFIFYFKEEKLKHILTLVLTLCLGSIMGLFIYYIFFQGFYEWIFNFKKEYLMLADHSPNLLVNRYIDNIKSLFIFFLHYFSWLIVFPLYIISKKYFPFYFNHKIVKYINTIAFVFSIILFIYKIYHFKFFRSTFASTNWINSYFYIIIISLQILLLLSFNLHEKNYSTQFLKKHLNTFLVILLLFVMPFIGAVGTANPILLNTLIFSAFWFSVIVILEIHLSKYIKSQVILSLFLIIPGIVTTSQIIDGNTFTPYYSVFFNKNKSNYFQQTEQITELPLLDGIHLDQESKKFLLDLNQLLKNNNYRKGYPIFGFHMPGVIYVMNGISPGMPYYFNTKRDCKAFECFRLKNNPPVIMVTEENPINNELLQTMKTKGITYPDDYVLKGEVYFPNTKSMLKVFFPKTLL